MLRLLSLCFFFCYDRVMIILIVLFYMVIYSILICSAHGYFKSLCPTREFNLFEFILLFVCLSLFFKRNSNYFHIRCQQTPTIVKKGATPLSVSDIISFWGFDPRASGAGRSSFTLFFTVVQHVMSTKMSTPYVRDGGLGCGLACQRGFSMPQNLQLGSSGSVRSSFRSCAFRGDFW